MTRFALTSPPASTLWSSALTSWRSVPDKGIQIEVTTPERWIQERGRNLVVVSPHLDDAILSLGATIATLVRAGIGVTIVTACGGDPTSTAPAGIWDAAGGFATEGQAIIARREEDRLACERVGAAPVWLPFGDEQYADIASDESLPGALEAAIHTFDTLLVPGFPLSHPDHLHVSRASLKCLPPEGAVGMYVEQPYALGAISLTRPTWADNVATLPPSWTAVQGIEARNKWDACHAYRSQLPLLQKEWPFMRIRMKLQESLRRGEPITWLR